MDVIRSPASYVAMLRALLPRGRAWAATPGGIMAALIDAIAQEFARFDARVAALTDELLPDSALELLPEWEALAGLPDACFPVADTTIGRQAAVTRKMAAEGGASRAFLIDQAAQIGIEIDIEEPEPFTCESGCDEYVFGDDWRFAFVARVLPQSEALNDAGTIRFSYLTCESGCDEPLDGALIDGLECLIRRAAHAHLIPLFAYPIDPAATLDFSFLEI